MKNKFSTTQEKVRKLTKKNKELIDEINTLQNTLKTKLMVASNTPRNELEVNELRTNLTVSKCDLQKQENLINSLKQSLNLLQIELKGEKEKYAKLEKEFIQQKAKNLSAIKTNKSEIDRLRLQIKMSKAKESKKLTSMHSKLSRNSNKQDLIHFSIFTNSLKTQSNLTQRNMSYNNQK